MVIYIGLRFILSYSKWNIYIIDYDLVIHALNRSFLLWGAPILFSFIKSKFSYMVFEALYNSEAVMPFLLVSLSLIVVP